MVMAEEEDKNEIICLSDDTVSDMIQIESQETKSTVPIPKRKSETVSGPIPQFLKRKHETIEIEEEFQPQRKTARTGPNYNLIQTTLTTKLPERKPIIKDDGSKTNLPNIKKCTPCYVVPDEDIIHLIEDSPTTLQQKIPQKSPITKLFYENHTLHDENAKCLFNNHVLRYRALRIGAHRLRIEMINPDNEYQLIHSSLSFSENEELQWIEVDISNIVSAWILGTVIGIKATLRKASGEIIKSDNDSISRGFLILMPEVATKPLISHLLPQPHVYKSTQQLQQINIAPNVLEKCQEARLIDGQYDMRETIIVNDKVILTYKNIDIKLSDLQRLNEGEMLNDIIIDFYLEYLQDAAKDDCVHIFHTTFFPLLRKDPERCAQKIPPPNVKIFEKDMILIPINQDLHWTLIMIIKPYSANPRITYCDSLGGDGSKFHGDILGYLGMRWAFELSTQKLENFIEEQAQLPLQQNYVDCGVYLLQYVELLIKHRSKLTFPMNLKDWFTSREIREKRQTIKKIIKQMAKLKA